MAYGDPYSAGTVSIDDGSPQDKTIVRGSGTLFEAFGIMAGDRFEYNGASISIAEVTDDNTIVLAYEWPFDDFADVAAGEWAIAQVSHLRSSAVEVAGSISDLRNKLQVFESAVPIFAIKEYGITEMPVDAAVNDRFVVAASGASGDLTGKGNQIVTKLETGLYFNEPSFGWHIVSEIDGSGTNVVRNFNEAGEWSTVGALASAPRYEKEWNSAMAYASGNVVRRLNKLYIADEASTDKAPESNADYWAVLLDIGSHGGAFVIEYVFKTSTIASVADTQGQVNADAALGSTPTTLRVNKLDVAGSDFAAALASISTASTSASKGKARLIVVADATKQFIADVTAVAAMDDRYDLTISGSIPIGTIADGASVLFIFDPKGDKGDIGNTGGAGPTGPHGGPVAIPMIFDGLNTGDADPGDGKFRLGNATQNEATMLRLSLKNSSGADITALLDSVADYTGSPKLMLSLRHTVTPNTKYLTATASAVASMTGRRNWTIAITGYSAANPFTNDDAVTLSWIPLQKGDEGDQGEKGDTGEPFSPDHTVATIDLRAAYDDAAEMTSVLVEEDSSHNDRPTLYFLITPAIESPATAAVWSTGFEFSTAAAASAIAFTPAGRITSENLQAALEELDELFIDQFEQLRPDIASAATVDLSAINVKVARITGATGITAITLRANQIVFVLWMANGAITDNGTSLLLDGGSRTNEAGKWSAFVANDDASVVREIFYSGGPTIDTDVTLSANSDQRYASQKAVKAYADELLDAVNGWQIKNVALDCSANPNYPAASAGHAYVSSVAGKIGGASGKSVEIGDIALCLVDDSAAGAEAAVGANWTILQANLVGAVINTRALTAGAGLIGGGDLSSDRSFAVGAGTGVVVNADDVAIDKASAAQIRSATNNKVVTADLIESASALVTLTDAGPVAWDWDGAINWILTITANRQISNPTNGQPGTYRTILVRGNNGTARTITWGDHFFGGPPSITDCTTSKWYLLTIYCISTTHFVATAVQAL